MRRRSLLRLGVASAALLAVAGAGVALWRPGLENGRLTAAGRRVFHAVSRAVLDGSLERDASRREAALLRHQLDRLDAAIAALPPAVRDDLSKLLGLLDTAAGRVALAGLRQDWPDASVLDVQSALQDMRLSSIGLRQQAYHALRDLVSASFYAEPAHWALIGYPGPAPL